MSQAIRLILVTVPLEETRLSMADFIPWFSEEIGHARGFRSFTVWQCCERPADLAMLMHFDDEETLRSGWEAFEKQDFLGDILALNPSAPDLRNLIVVRGKSSPGDVALDNYLSLSIRIADPGHGPELIRELEEIFASLEVLDGCVGSMVCSVEHLEEEIVGIVFWTNEEAFRRSLPSKKMYEVRLFKRIM
jgi:heme-degrading monooxygenase HmoA